MHRLFATFLRSWSWGWDCSHRFAAYQTLPTSSSYSYDAERPALLVDTRVTDPAPAHGPFDSTPVTAGQAAYFACDDPTLMAHYIPDFPPLQPTRVLGVQPTTSAEGMVYPPSSPGSPRHVTGLGIQAHSNMMSPTERSDVMPVPFNAADMNSPAFNRQGAFVGLPPRYSSTIHAYEVKGDPDGLNSRPSAFDMFSSKATAARRGPFKDHDQREKTARTRKMGSCIRCRMQRIRVSNTPPPFQSSAACGRSTTWYIQTMCSSWSRGGVARWDDRPRADTRGLFFAARPLLS